MVEVKDSCASRGKLFLSLVAVATLVGCGGGGSNTQQQVTTYGAAQALGNGTVRTFITRAGTLPVQLGVEFTPGVLTGLPALPMGQDQQIPLPVPPEFASLTPFMAAQMDWSPGHAPNGNQSVPHFHPTFFLISDSQRQQITLGGAGATVPIGIDEIPGEHIPAGMTIPGEGSVYFDPALQSYNEMPFQSTTYNYDFWNGHMVNIQLGVANAFVAKNMDQGDMLIQPQQYAVNGYFPTHYQFHYDATRQVYRMYLDGFVQRTTNPPNMADNGQPTVFGDPQPIGNGTARSFITRNGTTPVAVGVVFTPGILTGLPNIAVERAQDFPLPVPPGIGATPFKSISMEWSPGHIPPNQEVPHYQANFFLIDRTTQQRIFPPPLGQTTFVPVSAAETPVGTITFQNIVPFEGTPFIDPTNAQWSEQPFMTVGYNYDFLNGHMDNIQLGVTNAFLPTQKEVIGNIAQPQTYPTPGYYPTQYHIKFDPTSQQYTFDVEGFVKH